MTLKEEQSKIFDEWSPKISDKNGRLYRKDFRSDGVIDEEVWKLQEAKVMFILKEPNSGSGSLAYSLGHVLATRKVAPNKTITTWSNVSRWQSGIAAIMEDFKNGRDVSIPAWKDYKGQGKASCVENTLRKAVVLNLKKSAGTARSKDSEIEQYFKHHRDLFKRQYDLYKPDVVVCCGNVVTRCLRKYKIIDNYDSKFAHHYESPLGKIWCYAPESGPIVIGFFHPQCSKNHQQMFSTLISTLVLAIKG